MNEGRFMDLFQIILLASLIVGISLVVISMFIFNRENKNTALDYLERSNTIKEIDASIRELDNKLDEFDSLSSAAFDELDEKYQEILFLYNLLDEKKKELADILSAENKLQRRSVSIKQGDGPRVSNYSNPRAKQILELKDQGLTVTDIARQLNLGKGEVRLMIELSKGSVSTRD